MNKVFKVLLLLSLPFMFMTQGFSEDTTKKDVLNKLNERLLANKSPYQVLDFTDAKFKSGAIRYEGTGTFEPRKIKLLTGNKYENNSSLEQEVEFQVTEKITNSNTWTVSAGLEIGVGIETEVEGGIPGLGKANTKASGSVKVNASAGKGGTDQVEQEWSEKRIIKIGPYKIMKVCASVMQQESTVVPFTIPLYAIGEFDVVPRDVAKLYRFWKSPDHFYTTAQHEGLTAKYAEEGVTCLIHTKEYPGSVVLHRFYHGKVGDHFYTTSKDEGARASGYAYEGPVGWVYSSASKSGLEPLHRFFNAKSGDHFYSMDRNEGARASGYAYEGVACYVFPETYREKVIITDARMLPKPEDRTFEVKGVARAARQLDTEVSMDEESIPKENQSKTADKTKKKIPGIKLSTAEKESLKKKLSEIKPVKK